MKWNIQSVLNVLIVLMIGLYIGRYFYLKPGYKNGEKAPEISGTLLSGAPWSLSEMRGKYVLLDFWGSWCPPCRKKNPDLVAIYSQFNGADFSDAEGFEIVSVGIERNPESWQHAIDSDRLDWPYHLLDQTENLRFFSGGLAEAYGVKQLPTSYFIDPGGQIIGVNPSVKEILRRLQASLAHPPSG